MAIPRPRAGILEINPYIGGKAELDSDRELAKLSANECPIGPSSKAIAAFQAEGAQLHRYPDGGAEELRNAIARRYNLDPWRLVCGAGSDELIGLLVKAYAGPGDEVLYSAHGFLMYKLAALSEGAQPVTAEERGYRADVEALLSKVTSRTRIVFIANPNNPTGSYLTSNELQRLRQALPDDILLVIDAAYAEYVSADDYTSGMEMALAHDNVVMTRTFSKLHGLASLRLGWMMAHPSVIDVINRVRGPFNVSTPAQAAGIAALEDMDHQTDAKDHNDRWLPWLTDEIARLGFEVYPSVGNFVMIGVPKSLGLTVKDVITGLEKEGIIPRAIAAYGLPDCFRLSVGLEDDNRRAVNALAHLLESKGS